MARTKKAADSLADKNLTELVDELTVRFKLSTPWPIFKAYLPFNQVVSKDFVSKVGTDGMATQAMGSGPFKLVEWRRGDSLILERYDGYYGGAADIPPVGPASPPLPGATEGMQ